MENVIHDLETFYNYNMRVKKMMTYSPRLDMGEEETIEYVDKLFKNIVYMKDIFIGMIQLCGESNQAFDYVIKLFAKYQNLLLKCHYNLKKLQVFYNECISSMNTSLIESINREIMGYYLFNDYIHLLFKCKTINEMLHLFHAYVVNTESFYDNTPVVEAKKINNQEVYLRGDDSELASNLFKAIDFDLGSDKIDIISFSNNKILLMARDLGHALTMEINIGKDIAEVNYYIPKVCNYLMVNKLRGINKVKVDDDGNLLTPYAKGAYDVEKNELITSLIELLKGVQEMMICI